MRPYSIVVNSTMTALFIFGKIPCPVRLFLTVRLLDSQEYLHCLLSFFEKFLPTRLLGPTHVYYISVFFPTYTVTHTPWLFGNLEY